MKKIVLIILIGVFMFGGVKLFSLKADKATLINYTPFPLTASIGYGDLKGVEIQEEFVLEPGEKKEVVGNFRFNRKSFFLSCKTIDTTLVSIVYGDANTVYFEGDEERVYFNPKTTGLQQVNDTINNDKWDLFGFQKFNSKDVVNGYFIHDNSFYEFLNIPDNDDELKEAVFVKKAKTLNRTLRLQFEFNQRFPNPTRDFPFHLGVDLHDTNSNFIPGVEVTGVFAEKYADNGIVPLKKGDVIVGFNDQIVFSNYDLFSYLYLHGNSTFKGIEESFILTLIRDGVTRKVDNSYFFNPFFYPNSENQSLEAIYEGIKDTIFYGKSPEVATTIESTYAVVKDYIDKGKLRWNGNKYRINRWKRAQKRYRLKQFNQQAFTMGSIASMFYSPGQIFTKTIGKRISKVGLSAASSNQIASIAIEIGEESLWLRNTQSVVSSGQTFTEKLEQDLPLILSIGVITGSMNRFKI